MSIFESGSAMGLLTDKLTLPLPYIEATKYHKHVQLHGVIQFINNFLKNKDREDPVFKWGDEIEYSIVRFDHENNKVLLCSRTEHIIPITDEREEEEGSKRQVIWRPEYNSFMIEGIPGHPYGENGDFCRGLLEVEENMKLRRLEMKELLPENEVLLGMTVFPRTGCEDFIYFPDDSDNESIRGDAFAPITGSLFFPDKAIYQGHPRFCTSADMLTRRRGRKTETHVPVFVDEETAIPYVEDFSRFFGRFPTENVEESKRVFKDNHIYLDSPAFGMGMCCLQVTQLTKNLKEALVLYDQLIPLTPIMMALSANTAVHKGMLTDWDCRWNVNVMCSDDLVEEERKRGVKSKCHAVMNYLSLEEDESKYNDVKFEGNQDYYRMMVDKGVPESIARHISYLFIRDPIVVFQQLLDQDDTTSMNHFDNINSCNWQSLRLKPPPSEDIGWRVEFRTLDVQLTDKENAAFSVFVVLMSRMILDKGLNLLIPMSRVHENMETAHLRDSVRKEKFWFRNSVTGEEECMAINDIMNGNDKQTGLIPLLKDYLRETCDDNEVFEKVSCYIDLISRRASGEAITPAQWVRKFVRSHPSYKKDSVVTEEITYHLVMQMVDITNGKIVPEFL